MTKTHFGKKKVFQHKNYCFTKKQCTRRLLSTNFKEKDKLLWYQSYSYSLTNFNSYESNNILIYLGNKNQKFTVENTKFGQWIYYTKKL